MRSRRGDCEDNDELPVTRDFDRRMEVTGDEANFMLASCFNTTG